MHGQNSDLWNLFFPLCYPTAEGTYKLMLQSRNILSYLKWADKSFHTKSHFHEDPHRFYIASVYWLYDSAYFKKSFGRNASNLLMYMSLVGSKISPCKLQLCRWTPIPLLWDCIKRRHTLIVQLWLPSWFFLFSSSFFVNSPSRDSWEQNISIHYSSFFFFFSWFCISLKRTTSILLNQFHQVAHFFSTLMLSPEKREGCFKEQQRRAMLTWGLDVSSE